MADGITAVVYNVTKELAKRGHKVSVYTSDVLDLHGKTSLKALNLMVNGVNVCYLRSLWRYKTFIVTPSIVSILAKSLSDFDVIHIHDCRSFQGIFAYLFAKAKNIPYVFQPHGSYLSSLHDSPSKTVAKTALDKFVSGEIIRNASKIIALSQVEAEQYRSMGVPEEKIEIVPNGIDLSKYRDLPLKGSFKKKFGIDNDEKIVLYVGRIHESKGLDLLAQAFKIVSETVSNVRLVVVGPDDGYVAAFSRLISGLGIEEKVLFTGFVEKKDKLAAFVDSDVFVTPLFSGFPVTFLEACLACCPIVTASDELDWINNKVGYVTEYSSDSLAKGVASVLQDEQMNRRFRNNCRHMIKNFDISTVTHQLEKVYKEALSCGCY